MGLMSLQDATKAPVTALPPPLAQALQTPQAVEPPSPSEIRTPPTPPVAAPLPQRLDFTAEVYDFLLIAIPALKEYEASKTSGAAKPGDAVTVEIPPDMAESKLWRFFLLERDEILRHKWNRSKELDEDLGLPRAIKEWLHLHRALWIAAQQSED